MRVKLLLYVRRLQEGGTERRVERLARGLNGSRFQTAVAYSRSWGPVGERLRLAGIPVVRFSDRNAVEAESVIRGVAPGIFHSFTHKAGVDIAAATAGGTPLVMASRTNMREWDERLKVRPWELMRNRMSHRITSVSDAVASLCAQVEGVTRQNIVVIHSGVELPGLDNGGATIRQELGIAGHVPTIGYVANYRPEKAHELLLRSFRLVVDQRPDAHLICCGIMNPETGSGLAALVREMGLGLNVALLPSRSGVSPVYRGLDLYVHPSRYEGFSNSLLEAMSHALPVVATNVGGTPEAVVDGVTGLMVPKDDRHALAGAMLEMLANSDRAKRFGQAGRQRVARCFTVERMVEAYARLYDEVS
jgi:glycosyltransferase involved in cell wall biosynthesis